MHRFRLLGFYVVGVVIVIALAIWGVSMRRSVTEAGAPQPSAGRTVAPASAHTEPTPSNPSASQASSPAATTSTASVTKVSIGNFVFQPKELVVMAGTTVTWVNTDDVPHTATSSSSPPLFDSKALDTDDKFSFEFKTPGTYDYFCKLHPSMTGKVIVK